MPLSQAPAEIAHPGKVAQLLTLWEHYISISTICQYRAVSGDGWCNPSQQKDCFGDFFLVARAVRAGNTPAPSGPGSPDTHAAANGLCAEKETASNPRVPAWRGGANAPFGGTQMQAPQGRCPLRPGQRPGGRSETKNQSPEGAPQRTATQSQPHPVPHIG